MTAFGNAPQLRKAEVQRDSVSAVRISIPWILELKHHVDKQSRDPDGIQYMSSYFEQLARVPITLARLHTLNLSFDYDPSTLFDHHTYPALESLQLSLFKSYHVQSLMRSACSIRKLHMIHMPSDAAYECINNMDSIRDLTTRYLAASNDELTTLVEAMAERIYPLPALQSLNLDWYSMGIPEYPLAEMLAARWAGIEGAATITPFRFSQAHLEADIAHTLAQLPNLRPKD
ncbi:hypothetical protein C8R44DRAFT_880847 [Mycena epipterygia]|nr:hypothetical protein C8R44DRAFT_880847 [Mycena epipterygia]